MLDKTPTAPSIGDRLAHAVIAGWQRIVSIGNTEQYEGDERASPEQLAYADLLDIGMRIGLVGMVAIFLLYVSGLIAPQIPLADLPQYWSLPVHDYLAKSGAPTGWGWAKLLGKGDFLNLLPVAFLSTITIICYARILPMLRAKGDRIYATIVVAEIVVLVLAASGLLAGGH